MILKWGVGGGEERKEKILKRKFLSIHGTHHPWLHHLLEISSSLCLGQIYSSPREGWCFFWKNTASRRPPTSRPYPRGRPTSTQWVSSALPQDLLKARCDRSPAPSELLSLRPSVAVWCRWPCFSTSPSKIQQTLCPSLSWSHLAKVLFWLWVQTPKFLLPGGDTLADIKKTPCGH